MPKDKVWPICYNSKPWVEFADLHAFSTWPPIITRPLVKARVLVLAMGHVSNAIEYGCIVVK